ncbi:MAG: cyclase family protein [bacterium]
MGRTRIIDLSVPLEHDSPSEPFPAKITRFSHRDGAEKLGAAQEVPPDDFPDGMGLAWEEVQGITHAGTHLDAPFHFGPTAEGEPSKTIDQVPLEWCFGNGVVLDLTSKKPGEYVTVRDLQEALEKIDYAIQPGDIVLIRTGADRKWGSLEYLGAHPGMSREATLWLIEQGVRVMGTDGYGWDRPFLHMLADHKASAPGALWPGHFAGREREYCHIEKLTNLGAIPRPYGFRVAAFPIKVAGGSAGWCRAVAIFEDD